MIFVANSFWLVTAGTQPIMMDAMIVVVVKVMNMAIVEIEFAIVTPTLV